MHSMAVDNLGRVYVFGDNSKGQLGNNNYPTGENSPYLLPLQMLNLLMFQNLKVQLLLLIMEVFMFLVLIYMDYLV